jgi:hypothetical protein
VTATIAAPTRYTIARLAGLEPAIEEPTDRRAHADHDQGAEIGVEAGLRRDRDRARTLLVLGRASVHVHVEVLGAQHEIRGHRSEELLHPPRTARRPDQDARQRCSRA